MNELKSPCILYMLPPSFYEYLYYMKEQEYQEVDEKEECCLFLTPSERIDSAAYCIKAQVDVKSSTFWSVECENVLVWREFVCWRIHLEVIHNT